MSNLLSNLQKLPKVRSCRPVYIVDQHRKNPKKIVERVAESEKEFQSKRLLCKVAQRFFFFFRSLNLPSRLLCDFYTCWPKIALRRQQHCLSAARRLRGKREKGRSQIEFAVLPAGWFFVSAQQNLLPSICSAASFYVLKKIAERVGGLLAYAELRREHFFGQRANSINGKRLIDNFYPSTRLRHESTIPDSRLKPSSKPSQACIMSSSSDNELPLSAAEPRTPKKQPTPPPPLLHPSVLEARARPRGMMELRPSISSSQMPRGICSWTI